MKRLNETFKVTDNESNVKIGTARFTFKNGDNYEGKYQVDFNKCTLVKQDQGVYITDNFDEYNGIWYNDKFAGKFNIRYNNNARYEGNIDNGAMNGTGTYIFPDESSLMALWSQNQSISDVIYQKPVGNKWTIESISANQVLFTTGNHFWSEICEKFLEGNNSTSAQH